MKNYIFNQQELDNIAISNRSQYYFDDYLVATKVDFTKQNQQMVTVDPSKVSFKVQPFWEDAPFETDDIELQKMLDGEGAAFRTYLQKNPNYTMMVRLDVLNKLQAVQLQLPSNITLVLKAGHRPLSVQKQLFQEGLASFRVKYPNLSEAEIYKMNLEFVADADNFIPPHSTGGAVDIYLFDEHTGQPVDMGSPINFPDDRSWTYNTEISAIAEQNRQFLLQIMLNNGFANLASEWWHFSFGDQYWALFYSQLQCLFASVEE